MATNKYAANPSGFGVSLGEKRLRGRAMTEAEWLAATDPTPMLEFLRGKTSDRKLRLLSVASSYRIWRLLPPVSQAFNEAIESYADALITFAEYRIARDQAFREADAVTHQSHSTLAYATASIGISDVPSIASVASNLSTAASAAARNTAEKSEEYDYDFQYGVARQEERGEQTSLIRDTFGNPFRPVAVDPSWLTSTVLALAEGIYQERAFDRMPILADALQDAGCENDDILNHCRQPGEHVRGCWVVDLILGKQ